MLRLSFSLCPRKEFSLKRFASKALMALTALLLFTVVAYLPGLNGGFVYDDWGSITGNPNVQVVESSGAAWWRAALSFPSGTPPFRSLTMLSFAVNHFFFGLDPFPFKLINLAIHLLNGVLLFLVLRALFNLVDAYRAPVPHRFDGGMAAAALAGLWLLLPINLTGVLYVVQRLESFATTFIFLGLWWYLRARLRSANNSGGTLQMWLAIMLCTGVGITAKEPAVMLPLYAALADFCVTGWRNRDGRANKGVLGLYTTTLLLPLVVGIVWMWGRYLSLDRLVQPDSALVQRLLTESRVMFDYMAWTLLPNLDSLTLYHDDIPISRGLLDPPTTLASMLGIMGLLGAAVWQRHRRPLFAIGILWFFGGHLLTGTIIPLILAFEHRNYFPSAGLLLAAASLVSLEGGLVRTQARAVLVSVACLFWGGTTWMRAQEWSDPLRLAQSDAIKRPQSSAAQYDFAQALLLKSIETQKSEPANAALRVLDQARRLPGAGIHFEQSMITLLAESGYRAPGEVWESLISKLKARGPDTNEVHALVRLNHCFSNKECKPEDLPMLAKGYEVALSHPNTPSSLLAVHGEYAWHVINDRKLAERDYREVLRRSPKEIEAASNLIVVLIHQGKFEEAEALIMDLESRNHLSALDGFLKPLHSTLESVRKRQETHDD